MRAEIFRESYINANVLSIACHTNYILAGIGSELFVYENDEVKMKMKIFQCERIHNIIAQDDSLLIKGCKEIALMKLMSQGKNKVECCILCSIKCNDWILDAFLDAGKQQIILCTAHNIIQIWSTESGRCIQSYVCEEKCILYSCTFFGNHVDDFVVLSGTVFSEILVWFPSRSPDVDQPVIHRLAGHDGVIFSVTVDITGKIICSTSDDRSVRIWRVDTDGSLLKRESWEKAVVTLTHSLYGHTSRVWKCLIFRDAIVSVGEDSNLCMWNKNGGLEKSLHLHQGYGIRGLSHNTESIVTGGEDGGLTVLPIGELKSRITLQEAYSLKGFGQPRKVTFLKGSVCCTTDRGFVLLTDARSTTVIYECEEFSNYCLVEVSTCEGYLMLGSITGRIVVIDARTGSVCLDQRVIDGKIFSMHWLNDEVIICARNGLLFVFGVETTPDTRLIRKKTFVLPNSKERWTTCASIHRRHLVTGDRMGSVHVYDMTSTEETPERSFPRIHGHLGVTDIKPDGDVILTCGRDGSVREFRFVQGRLAQSVKRKLPMEWPWKIVPLGKDSLVLGFSSVELVVWSLKNRWVVSRHDCGGGHRSSDFVLTDGLLKFLYIRDKKILTVDLPLPTRTRPKMGFHGKEINCLAILRSHPFVIVTGSEDTTLRIARILENDLDELYVIENHISSVRDVSVLAVSELEKLLFSSGGRAQISVHGIRTEDHAYEFRENYFLYGSDRKVTEPCSNGETRIMCIDSVAFSGEVFVSAACSDRQIRFFTYRRDIRYLLSIPYGHCVLKVKFFERDGVLFVASMATDGRVVFWDVSDIMQESYRMMGNFKIHQSGINSFELKILESGKILLATGGDDNLLSVLLLKLEEARFIILRGWKNSSAHSCQITGIKLIGNLMLTTSIDQRLTVWKCDVTEDVVSLRFIDQYISSIADIQGMETFDDNESISICLYGKGLQFIDINRSALLYTVFLSENTGNIGNEKMSWQQVLIRMGMRNVSFNISRGI